MIDYYKIIKKYINPNSELFPLYITHCSLVTSKALTIAKNLNLSPQDCEFIEEASMLHDIGIVMVNEKELFCFGTAKYIEHGVLGREILERENLPIHALVCERHTGTGIYLSQIINNKLPLPHRDILATNLNEEIISYADLFFTKSIGKGLFNELSVEYIIKDLSKYGEKYVQTFWDWHKKFCTSSLQSKPLN